MVDLMREQAFEVERARLQKGQYHEIAPLSHPSFEIIATGSYNSRSLLGLQGEFHIHICTMYLQCNIFTQKLQDVYNAQEICCRPVHREL